MVTVSILARIKCEEWLDGQSDWYVCSLGYRNSIGQHWVDYIRLLAWGVALLIPGYGETWLHAEHGASGTSQHTE